MTSNAERFLVPWFSAKKNGLDRPYWLGILRDYGCEVDGDRAPCYSDVMPRKPKGGEVVFEMFPELGDATLALRAARGRGLLGCLVVPHFGHFGSAAVWETIAMKVADVGALVIEASSGVELDGTDIEAGKALLRKNRSRAATAGRKAARSQMGRPKLSLGGKRLEEALRLFADPNWSIPMLAARFGFGTPMTFLRRIKEATGTWSKGVAVRLAERGGWPPKRKLTDGEVKRMLLEIEATDGKE